jgi:hypothetical protein
MVKRVAVTTAGILAAVVLLAGPVGAARKAPTNVGCSISVAVQPTTLGYDTGVITVNGWGLTAGKQVTMWYSVPNMGGFLGIDNVAADGTTQDVSYTSYSGAWLGSSWTYTAQIWASSTGSFGKGSPLASCTTTISL